MVTGAEVLERIQGVEYNPPQGGAMTGEEIATALDTVLGSAEWRGGDTAMTGEAIRDALDSLFGDAAWRTPMDGDVISETLDTYLGDSAWKSRTYERAPLFNVIYPVIDSSEIRVAAYNGTIATIVNNEWYYGFLPDGVQYATLDECDFVYNPGEITWRFPTSLDAVTVTETSDGALFDKLVAALVQNPYWINTYRSRTLDCNAISVPWTFASSDTQSWIDSLLDGGWTIYTPELNIVPSPWQQIMTPGIPGRLQPDGMTSVWVAQGDGGATLDGSDMYWAASDSTDPLDYIPISYTEHNWPGRQQVDAGAQLYVTFNGANYFVHIP